MPVTNVYTVDGGIIGERTSGSSRLDYVPDSLGSVVAAVDQTKEANRDETLRASASQVR